MAKATDKQFIVSLILINLLLMILLNADSKQETMQHMEKKTDFKNGIIIRMQNTHATQIWKCYHKRMHLS